MTAGKLKMNDLLHLGHVTNRNAPLRTELNHGQSALEPAQQKVSNNRE